MTSSEIFTRKRNNTIFMKKKALTFYIIDTVFIGQLTGSGNPQLFLDEQRPHSLQTSSKNYKEQFLNEQKETNSEQLMNGNRS